MRILAELFGALLMIVAFGFGVYKIAELLTRKPNKDKTDATGQ